MNNKLDKTLKELEQRFGLVRKPKIKPVEIIRTGIYAFDYVIDGIKIVEGGHKIELYGKESSGKTTIALKIVKAFQELDKICVWEVSESFHKEWARKMGVDVDRLLKHYPKSAEDAGDKILEMVSSVDLVVTDSVASLIPEAELKCESLSDKTRGAQAKVYSEFTRKLYRAMAHETTVLVFINQIRMVMGKLYGNPEETPGGRALRHLYDSRVEIRAGKPIRKKIKGIEETLGVETNMQGFKNKLGVAKRKAVVDFYFEDGRIDNNKTLFFAGIKYGVIQLLGKTYTYGKKKAVGQEKFRNLLTADDYMAIESNIWERMK